jgi:hypothetical protein
MNFFHSLDTCGGFSWSARDSGLHDCIGILTVKKLLDSGTPVVVLDRGLDLDGVPCRSGVVGELLVGEGIRGEWIGEGAAAW